MRAKPSSTAVGILSCFGTLPASIAIDAWNLDSRAAAPGVTMHNTAALLGTKPVRKIHSVAQGEGLLHDAHNLMNALGLYVDLLALPGVLKPEHRHYAKELRVLATRSGTLMERLVHSLPTMYRPANAVDFGTPAKAAHEGEGRRSQEQRARSTAAAAPVNLRETVERYSGLVSQVAGGRMIELDYGPAASAPLGVEEEDVERILVNLVRNAAAALDRRGRSAEPKTDRDGGRPLLRYRTAEPDPEAVRIGIGMVQNGPGDPKPWILRRVRLTVEDSGCGMSPQELERLLRGGRAPARGSRGIGFCVVRELVAAGGGELRVMSAAGVGTRVQIEWPIVNAAEASVARPGDKEGSPSHLEAREGEWPLC